MKSCLCSVATNALWICLSFAIFFCGSVTAQTRLVVDFERQHQVIDNFGASDAWSINPVVSKWISEGDDAAIERLAGFLFSTDRGIGLSAWRFNIGAGSAGQGAASRIPDPLRRAELIVPSPGGNIDRTKQAGQIRLLQEAHQRGVTNFIAFLNSPPVWATKNGLSHPAAGTHIGSSNLNPSRRGEFIAFLVQVLQYLRGPEVGVPVNYISPVNEPTWDWQGQTQEGTPYNVADIKTLYRELDEALQQVGLSSSVHIDGPEAVEYTAALSDEFKQRFDNQIYNGGMNGRGLGLYRNYISQFLGDPAMRRILGNKISLHGYFSDAWEDRLGALRDLVWENVQQVSPDAKVWMSEFCILGDPGNARDFSGNGYRADDMQFALHLATVVHRDLIRLNASAWHWWLAVTPYDYKDGLLKISPQLEAHTLTPTKAFWAFGNFSRYIRPGYQRIALNGADDLNGLLASAFKSADDDKLVIVVVNNAPTSHAIELEFKNAPFLLSSLSLTGYVTDRANDLSPFDCGLSMEIPGESVLTIVGTVETPRKSDN